MSGFMPPSGPTAFSFGMALGADLRWQEKYCLFPEYTDFLLAPFTGFSGVIAGGGVIAAMKI